MRISRKDWNLLVRRLSAISSKAAEDMRDYMYAHPRAEMSDAVMVANAIATKYGEASASLACDMYDAVAEASGITVPPAEPAPTATYSEVAKAVYGTAKTSPASIPQTVGRLVKTAGADTTLRNAQRDGAQFAWIPNGDSCAFCITLASRGWQYMSKKAMKNGHAIHIHSNCDCEYAIRFSEDDGVEGYDPQKYRDIYYGAEGDTPKERINAIRRKQYAIQKEKDTERILVNKDGVRIAFEGRIKDDNKFAPARKMIQELSSEYSTRLGEVTVGAEKAAGDVDISGFRMRLNTSQLATVLHEFAHTLANSSADKYGITNDKEFWKEIRKVRRAYHKDVDSKQDPRRWISAYEHSSRDVDEFMAEAFAHAKAEELGLELPSKYGKDFTYSRKVLEIVNKYFKK